MLPSGLGIDDIFDAHHGLVFRTAYRITGNAADAEDVLQTVFLRLGRRNPAAGALENPERYLRRAAINVALDLVRSGKDQMAASGVDSRSGPLSSRGRLLHAIRYFHARHDPV